eukprot:622830-Rhodomonas_salina.2
MPDSLRCVDSDRALSVSSGRHSLNSGSLSQALHSAIGRVPRRGAPEARALWAEESRVLAARAVLQRRRPRRLHARHTPPQCRTARSGRVAR